VKRTIYFGDFDRSSWPDPRELERYFLDPTGEAWPHEDGNDEWGLDVDGLYGTSNLGNPDDRVIVHLAITGYPNLGATLHYAKWDGRTRERLHVSSQGDLRRLNEIVVSMQGTPMSAGLFVPFADAYRAVKEFMETDGELPPSIRWGPGAEIPQEAFFSSKKQHR
jgi:hypothetical protein